MSDVHRKWFYLIVLSLIWGTSYILIKKGLQGFNPVQLGTMRVLITSLFMAIIGFRSLRGISREQWKWIAVSGMVGSFIPVFLFAFAQTEIDSSIASILNSTVPLFTIIVGFLWFGIYFSLRQFLGVIIGLLGAIILIVLGASINPDQNYKLAGLVILATVGYAFNANIIKSKLQDVSPLGITTGNFMVMVLPALIIFAFSGVTNDEVVEGPYFMSSLGYLIILAIIGTCVAKVMFTRLIQISTPVFSVSVTYLIPVVGVLWGLLDGELFKPQQLLAAMIILFGVYLVNKKSRQRKTK
ncbi:MAG: EamA family transporter [Eudoraea sp.]|nr:EamA family transporter [Eudoraea sp.]